MRSSCANRVGAAVRLVIDADVEKAPFHPQDIDIGAQHAHELGLEDWFRGRRRVALVIELPVRLLGVAEPQVAVVAQHVLEQLGLETELELASSCLTGMLSVAVLLRYSREAGRWGCRTSAAAADRRVCRPEQEQPAFVFGRQFPAFGQCAAARLPRRDLQVRAALIAPCSAHRLPAGRDPPAGRSRRGAGCRSSARCRIPGCRRQRMPAPQVPGWRSGKVISGACVAPRQPVRPAC